MISEVSEALHSDTRASSGIEDKVAPTSVLSRSSPTPKWKHVRKTFNRRFPGLIPGATAIIVPKIGRAVYQGHSASRDEKKATANNYYIFYSAGPEESTMGYVKDLTPNGEKEMFLDGKKYSIVYQQVISPRSMRPRVF